MIIIVLQCGVSIICIIIIITITTAAAIAIGIRLVDDDGGGSGGRMSSGSRSIVSIIMPIVVIVLGMPRRSPRVIFRDDGRVGRLVRCRHLRTVMLSHWNGYGRRQFRGEIQEAH